MLSLHISTRQMHEHGHVQCRSPAQAQHPSPLHGAPGPAPGPLPLAPGPHHNGPGPGPLLQPPTAAPVARGPPQPLTQFPVELGNFINKLPPARALEGGHPNVDQVRPSRLSTSLAVYLTVMYPVCLGEAFHNHHSLVYTGLRASSIVYPLLQGAIPFADDVIVASTAPCKQHFGHLLWPYFSGLFM